MSVFKDVLDPNEQIIWETKPDTKAFMLPAFGGWIFALIFLGISSIWIIMGVPPYLSPLVITVPAAIILMVVPPFWFYGKLRHVGYMITNQRLLAKTGIHSHEYWSVKLTDIKDVYVKIGFVDPLFGTGYIYPITEQYPYEPKIYGYTEKGMYNLKKVYNLAKQEYEQITEMELWRNTRNHPNLKGLKNPYEVQKLLREAIFGAGTNIIDCEYCHFRYDLNKEGKCPSCGGIQKPKYNTP